ncbi:uncharacterized protein LOC126625649 [Malus sylvestris]|uniref:uncharacterized protein n=1 Tax=Malus domestica TaxID=3750 RepID=UPI000498DB16|nr:uncharacterized protein LOC103438247 [Malus domestica]XP_050150635.1 uncharacterized protein LOC126625649 [Malus sylvestris]
MAALLPRSFALKSNNNQKYLRYIHQSYENLHGILQFSEVDDKSPNAKFQMEPAYGGYEGLVHIKCCYNNKYLRRPNEHQHWIVAQADRPEEDLNHWTCTLFEPRVVHADNKAVLRILHVQLGHYVMSLTSNDFHQCLFAERADPNPQNDLDVCTVVDLDPLALPNTFVLKSNICNKYLRYMLDEENQTHEIVQFSGKDPKSEYSIFQVEQANNQDDQDNHYVHIKCTVNNKYFRRMDKDKQLIMAAADQRDENKKSWACTLFKPEHVGQAGNNNNNVLCRLRHVQSNLYTRPFVENRFELRLNGERPDPQGVDVYTAIRSVI